MATGTFTGDAAIKAAQAGTFTGDAAILRARTGSFTADATIKVAQTGSFTAAAVIKATQATTAISACNAIVVLDNAGGTPTDISGSTNRIKSSIGQDLGRYHVHGSDWPKRLDGERDGSFTLTVLYTTAANEGFEVLRDWIFAANPGARSIRIDTPNSSAGSDRYTAEVRIEDLRWTLAADKGGPVMVTARLMPDGEISHVTIS